MPREVLRNSEGVATAFATIDATLFRVASSRNEMRCPRVAKAQRYHPVRAARTGTPVLGCN